ncbi:MAG: protein translocase subunit SecDF [Bacteroidetes bacterium]|nr:protein translocase subunit SecDF [Bacteroidota bacterium]
MQLKGLVRFFTVLLIIYSLYQLSYTWFVRQHEKKMETRARAYVKKNFPSALEKFPNNKELQIRYQDSLDKMYQQRLDKLLDSTKDKIITYGINGAVSYKKAKAEELNLGLDLQGGMSVTLEVEMTGLLRSLANDSKDPNFLAALQNANNRKANSGADFVTLFVEEYGKPERVRPLASLFAGGASGQIDINSSDSKVESYRQQANEAFDRTYNKLTKRIDQFGVAQPSINPIKERSLINVELPGVKDKERVRKLLQSTANLQFWETYKLTDLGQAFVNFDNEFDAYLKGTLTDSVPAAPDTTPGTNPDTTKNQTPDTTKHILSKNIDTAEKTNEVTAQKRSIQEFIQLGAGEGIGLVNLKDTSAVMEYLTSDPLRRHFPPDAVFAWGEASRVSTKQYPLYVLRTYNREKAPLEGDAITKAEPQYDNTGKPIVSIEMNNAGAIEWGKITEKSFRDKIPIAIVLDGVVYSAPIAEGKLGNRSQITGNFSIEQATDLANILKIGKLDAPAKIVQDQQVGPTLGKKAILGGSKAFIISFVVIFLLMLVYYNTSGWVANIALILNLLFTVGILAGLGATLTAPGIAGLVLTIGMAVDTNVIIYERIKEELTRGKGYIPAINDGYRRSLPPVLDAHVTTLLTAIILFYFGLGPVKGFATTQIIGILLSLFCGILVSRWITDIFTNKKKHLQYFTGISRRIFQHAKFKFIEYRKYTYVISVIVLALGIASYFNGFHYGVEFNGGRSFQVKFDKPVDVEKARTDLRVAFGGENPIIKTVGDNSTLDITTSYQIDNPSITADSIVESKLMEGLINHLPQGITYEKFDTQYKLGSNKVLPTISDDLKSGAVKATVFALVIIFLYIFVRFRDWRYSLGTIVALLHDVFVTLAVFSFARNIVPFPLEIDQHFIAAVLTVIGFSMNDTVIVFDRIREDSSLMPNAPRTEVINRAINETLSRTIMTSLTVFLTILILFLVGGEVTKGFAFAMLIGVVTGTYSSIFVAAPILVDLGGRRALGKKTMEAAPKPEPAVVKS